MKKISQTEIERYLNYLIIIYAFSFPLSKAIVNSVEILSLIVWIYQGEWRYKLNLLKSNRFIAFLGLFLLWNLITIPWASSTPFALQYIGKYHHFLMIPIIYTSLKKEYISPLFFAFVSSVFISEIISYGISFRLFTYGNATPEFPTPFMHHITYSVVLAFTSTILLVNFLKEKRVKYKLFEIVFFITIVTNLFINGGRTGQVVFLVLMFLVLLSYLKQKLKALFFATLLVCMTFFSAYTLSSNFALRVHQFEKGVSQMIYKNDYTGQGGMRVALWIVGSDVFKHNYLTGTGIGNEMSDANHYASLHSFKTKDMREFGDYHNVFVNISVQLGLIGIFLILSMLYALAKLNFKTKGYKILNSTFIVSFILFSFTHNTMHLMFPMVFFSLFSGLFSAISRIENQTATL